MAFLPLASPPGYLPARPEKPVARPCTPPAWQDFSHGSSYTLPGRLSAAFLLPDTVLSFVKTHADFHAGFLSPAAALTAMLLPLPDPESQESPPGTVPVPFVPAPVPFWPLPDRKEAFPLSAYPGSTLPACSPLPDSRQAA